MNKKYLQLFKEFLSFDSPRAVVINFSFIFIIFGIIPTAFWDTTPNICLWRMIILPFVFHGYCPEAGFFAHCFCPGCGMTHALSALFHGNFTDAYNFNRLVYIVIIILIVIYLKNVYTFISTPTPSYSPSGRGRNICSINIKSINLKRFSNLRKEDHGNQRAT